MNRSPARFLLPALLLVVAGAVVYFATRSSEPSVASAAGTHATDLAGPNEGALANLQPGSPPGAVPQGSGSASPEHMAEKNAKMAELERMRREEADQKDDDVDLDEPRPVNPLDMGNVESKREKAIDPAHKAMQTDRAIVRIEERIKRLQGRLDQAKSSGDAAETERLTVIVGRLSARLTKLQETGQYWRQEAAAASASAGSTGAPPPEP